MSGGGKEISERQPEPEIRTRAAIRHTRASSRLGPADQRAPGLADQSAAPSSRFGLRTRPRTHPLPSTARETYRRLTCPLVRLQWRRSRDTTVAMACSMFPLAGSGGVSHRAESRQRIGPHRDVIGPPARLHRLVRGSPKRRTPVGAHGPPDAPTRPCITELCLRSAPAGTARGQAASPQPRSAYGARDGRSNGRE